MKKKKAAIVKIKGEGLKVRMDVDRSTFVTAEFSTVSRRINFRSFIKTKNPFNTELHICTIPVDDLPKHPFEMLEQINLISFGCAWPFPPAHHITEAWRDCAAKLL